MSSFKSEIFQPSILQLQNKLFQLYCLSNKLNFCHITVVVVYQYNEDDFYLNLDFYQSINQHSAYKHINM